MFPSRSLARIVVKDILDARCFASCYIEASFALSHPGMVVWENLDLWARLRRAVAGVLT